MRRFLQSILGAALAVAVLAGPATATDASGYSITACSTGNVYGGGLQVFNGDSQSGGDRVMCVLEGYAAEDWDLDEFLGSWEGDKIDIGSFDDKTNSITIRANPNCKLEVWFYDGYNPSGGGNFAKRTVDNIGGGSPMTVDQDLADDKLSSLRFLSTCP